MSAVYGLLRLDGSPLDHAVLAAMGLALSHRGPDGRAQLALDGIGLGHCLLRVNREDRFEAQPVHDSKAGLTLVADIRLDNREELAAELGIDAAALATLPESALLLAAWARWGEECPQRLIGDFAFALWDKRQRRLYLCCDHMGQRSLFFHHGAGFLAFASEIKALWTVPGVPRELDEGALARRLLGPLDAAAGGTVYAGIAALPGATLRRIDADGCVTVRQYWQPRAGAQHLGRDDAYYRAAYRRVVEEAIACRVRRLDHAPLLLFSGGFDSGTIAAIAGPIVAAKGSKVLALASVLPDGEKGEVRDARKLVSAFADRPEIDIQYYTRGDDSPFTDLEAGFARNDDSRATDIVRRAAFALARARGLRLVMDGHGGDYTVNMLDGGMLGRFLLRGKVLHFLRELSARRAFTGSTLAVVLWYEVAYPLTPRWLLKARAWLRRGATPQWQARFVDQDFARRMIAEGQVDAARLRNGQVTEGQWISRWLHMLRKVMAMPAPLATMAGAQQVDFTRPFHDPRVVEFGLAIPEHLQFRDGRERWLARTCLADLLPPSLIARLPGNPPEKPDVLRTLTEAAPQALARLKADPQGCAAAARYVDLAKVENVLAREHAFKPADLLSLQGATNALVVGRFAAWFNRREQADQEP